MSTEATFRPRGLRQIAVLISCLPLVLLSAAAQETAASGKPPVTIKELVFVAGVIVFSMSSLMLT